MLKSVPLTYSRAPIGSKNCGCTTGSPFWSHWFSLPSWFTANISGFRIMKLMILKSLKFPTFLKFWRYWMLQISVASIGKDIKRRKPLKLPTFRVSRMVGLGRACFFRPEPSPGHLFIEPSEPRAIKFLLRATTGQKFYQIEPNSSLKK